MKKILVDTNILLDIFTANDAWAEWSISQLEKYQRSFTVVINHIIYSELSVSFEKIEDLEKVLYQGKIKVIDIPREALFLAGKVFLKYRRENKGTKTSTLPDFFIGAHAAFEKFPIITRDSKRMKYYFPTLKVICP